VCVCVCVCVCDYVCVCVYVWTCLCFDSAPSVAKESSRTWGRAAVKGLDGSSRVRSARHADESARSWSNSRDWKNAAFQNHAKLTKILSEASRAPRDREILYIEVCTGSYSIHLSAHDEQKMIGTLYRRKNRWKPRRWWQRWLAGPKLRLPSGFSDDVHQFSLYIT